MKKALFVLAFACALSGCSNLKLQWSASYQTDNLAEDLKAAKEQAK